MTSPQKAKGGGFEREVAKFLSDLYEESFIRTPHSGAFVGGLNQHRKSRLTEEQVRGFKGDVQAPSSWPRFNCEAKFYAEFPFHQLIQGSCKQLDSWLNQLMDVAEPNDFNILCMKFNRKGRYIAIQDHLKLSFNHSLYKSPNHGFWLIADFDTFFQHHADYVKSRCIGD